MTQFYTAENPPKWDGESSLILAAEVTREGGALNPRIDWTPAPAIPAGLCFLYEQAGVAYWGRA